MNKTITVKANYNAATNKVTNILKLMKVIEMLVGYVFIFTG